MKNIYHEGKLINKAGVDRVVLSHVELKKINWPVFKGAITASSDIIYDAFRSANRTYYVTEGGDRLHYLMILTSLKNYALKATKALNLSHLLKSWYQEIIL